MRVAALLLTGCWSGTAAPPAAPVQSSSAVIVDGTSAYPTRTRSRRDMLRHSVWEGTYICNQGLSAVTLTLDVDRSGNATARYDFGPVPSNPTVPEGSYRLTGVVQRQPGGGFSGELDATEWIVRPSGYFMVPLSIESGDGKTMTGTIKHTSCSQFQTTRIN